MPAAATRRHSCSLFLTRNLAEPYVVMRSSPGKRWRAASPMATSFSVGSTAGITVSAEATPVDFSELHLNTLTADDGVISSYRLPHCEVLQMSC